ncbi:hypothetical protein GXB85_04100 [Cellulomonas sp. APG4]|uniref:hypothetical protein n=1 Tax=Cellulomonas sp. APG4 TaxID=1538656 RepID=UPI00137B5B55|nr:hypothetical protein [Cellulomonas sp. APG4]NCT90137.1 hypothetical protein [Cellulomonas sp. APG4]
MTDTRIEAKVARILTARELVLNRGSDAGVEVGMRFAILNRRGNEIIDPETKEVLGSVELPKTFVKVISVDARLCVARTFREFYHPGQRGALDFTSSLSTLMASIPERTEVETLKTDETRMKDEMDEADSFVKTGDPAVQVIGNEYAGMLG